MEIGLYSILFVPLFAACFGAMFLRRSKWGAAVLSITSAAYCLGMSLHLMLSAGDFKTSFELFRLGDFALDFGVLFDGAVRNMLFVVTFVGLLIHIFSVGYMNHDEAKGRFFTGLSFFMFSMTGLVISPNLFQMFIFWEFVGFSSYALIAHYADTSAAREASKKAFIVNRVGDFGFLLGIIFCLSYFGTTDFGELGKVITANPALASTAMGLLIICGFLGKSAQFPLQVWLPDAMAGPTPVSALIHAATMVAAGVFMLVRLSSINFLTNEVLDVILILCSAMAFLAGFWALGQSDIKKILAYSTLAHLGLMGAGVALGYELAMFHLTTHAFFKATLFLVAGSVIHACAHEQDIFKMGGLFKRMPLTSLVALAATLSILAIPFFAGYYSKEAILGAAFAKSGAGLLNRVAFWLIMGAAVLTPIYMGRLFFNTFLGKPNSEKAASSRESSLFMTLPLIILAVYSIGGAWGFIGDLSWANGKMAGLIPASASSFVGELIPDRVASTASAKNFHAFEMIAVASTFVALILAWAIYSPKPYDPVRRKLPFLYDALAQHGWFDKLYNWYVAKVQQRIAVLLATFVDLFVIELVCVRGVSMVFAVLGYGIKRMHDRSALSQVRWFVVGLLLLAILALI